MSNKMTNSYPATSAGFVPSIRTCRIAKVSCKMNIPANKVKSQENRNEVVFGEKLTHRYSTSTYARIICNVTYRRAFHSSERQILFMPNIDHVLNQRVYHAYGMMRRWR